MGPYTSIYDNAVVRNSEVEFSIILKECRLLDVGIRIEGSLLGCDTAVVRAGDKPRTHRFVVGDQSVIELA